MIAWENPLLIFFYTQWKEFKYLVFLEKSSFFPMWKLDCPSDNYFLIKLLLHSKI